MKRVISAAPPNCPRLFRARVDSIWLNTDLEDSRVVLEEYAVVGRRGDEMTLDRELNGLKTLPLSAIGTDVHRCQEHAILALYRKFLVRLELACSNEDVIAGRISEQAAVLNGLN